MNNNMMISLLKGIQEDYPLTNAEWQAIEQAKENAELCEDEYIKVPKKALKYVTKGMVAYNYEWLKNHFDIERAVICGVQQTKTGHWQHYEGMLICSECGTEFYDDIMEYCGDDVPKWCPNCGCFMFEPQESEDKG